MTVMVPTRAMKVDTRYFDEVLATAKKGPPPEETKTAPRHRGKYGYLPTMHIEDRTYLIGEERILADLGPDTCGDCRKAGPKPKLSSEDSEVALVSSIAAVSRAESVALDTGVSHLPLEMPANEGRVMRPMNPYDFTVERQNLTGSHGSLVSAFDLFGEKPLVPITKPRQPVCIVPMHLANGSLRLRNVMSMA